MAETTDQPTDKAVTASAPEASPPADKAVTASAPAAPALSGSKDASPIYASVSLIAILGFGLASLYAGSLAVGAVIALFNHTPMILPIGTLAIPLVAAAVCWAARTRIRKAEGALTGTRLAMWGAGLSLVAGLLYAAYYAGNYMAVSSQAKSFTDQWMELLKKDQVDRAFLYTVQPDTRPPDDAGLRDSLELNFDRSGARGGQLTSFRGSDLVRQFEEDGPNADIQYLGVAGWEYTHASYVVTLTYRVTTADIITDLAITAVAMDDQNGERKWFAQNASPIKRTFTPAGERMQLLTSQAHEIGQQWLEKIQTGDLGAAYLLTLPPSERERAFPAMAAAAAGSSGSCPGQGPLGTASALLSSPYRRFMDGGVVHYDPEKFWVAPGQSDTAARRDLQAKKAEPARALFSAGPKDMPLALAPGMPIYSHDGATSRVSWDFPIVVGKQIIQARVLMTGDFGPGDPTAAQWRIESLELLSSKTATPMGPPGAGGPAGAAGKP